MFLEIKEKIIYYVKKINFKEKAFKQQYCYIKSAALFAYRNYILLNLQDPFSLDPLSPWQPTELGVLPYSPRY